MVFSQLEVTPEVRWVLVRSGLGLAGRARVAHVDDDVKGAVVEGRRLGVLSRGHRGSRDALLRLSGEIVADVHVDVVEAVPVHRLHFVVRRAVVVHGDDNLPGENAVRQDVLPRPGEHVEGELLSGGGKGRLDVPAPATGRHAVDAVELRRGARVPVDLQAAERRVAGL